MDLAFWRDKMGLSGRAFERLQLATWSSLGQPEPGPRPLHAFRCSERLAATASSGFMRSLALALLPTLLAAAPAPFEAARLRGQELAQRIRLEEACGRLAGQRPSPLLDLGPERWTAYFLDPGAPEAPRASFVLACPAGKPEALAPQAAGPLPARLSAQARLLAGVLRQLGAEAREAHLVTVPEPDGGASLYRLPRQEAGFLVFGRDFRLRALPGATAFERTVFHHTLFRVPLKGAVPTGSQATGFVHNHVNLADPCETDVAAALLNPGLDLGVLGPGDSYFTCHRDGRITQEAKPAGSPSPEGTGGPAPTERMNGLCALAFGGSALDRENTWVVMPSRDGDASYTYVCVYLDLEAGFTSQLGGSFTLDASGRAKASGDWPADKASFKIRLERDFPAAPMPEGIRKDLGLEAAPAFLAAYRGNPSDPQQQLRRGWHLNHVGESARALATLEPLYARQPTLPGLAFEVAFAHNALGEQAKALPVLEAASKHSPQDAWILRELAYTYLHLRKAKEAVATYLRALPLVPEDNAQERSEQAINLAQAYELLGDAANRDAWLAKAKAWAPEGSPVAAFFARQQAAPR